MLSVNSVEWLSVDSVELSLVEGQGNADKKEKTKIPPWRWIYISSSGVELWFQRKIIFYFKIL